ncbi:hypothetical protein ACFWBG_22040 [Nocardia salmonicida]|uniref:hypothetical protein n=1 Tax=Nocardia salmonicida TaxID=53431 RepID=UPI00366E147D
MWQACLAPFHRSAVEGSSAEPAPSTGSSEQLAAILASLTSGSGEEAEDVVEEEAETGSADGLAALLAQLTSGSGEAAE